MSPSPSGRGARGEGKIVGLRSIFLAALLTFLPSSIAVAADPDDLAQLLQYGYCTACDLSGADLSGMNFANAVLTGSIFTSANLSGANLQHTDLSHAIFNAANLSGTDFSFANLNNASLAGAIMRPAANFTGADLRGAVMPGGAIRSNDPPDDPRSGTIVSPLPTTNPAVPTDRLQVHPLGEAIPLPTTDPRLPPVENPTEVLRMPSTNPAVPTPQNATDPYQANPIPWPTTSTDPSTDASAESSEDPPLASP